MLATLIWFIIILSVIVISHEFGHFIIARVHGIAVREFDVGMGPTICSFTKNGTKFCLKCLPLGGACVFEGEDILPDTEGKEAEGAEEEREENTTEVRPEGISFREANVWHRISTVFAGPFFNFILAMIFAVIIVSQCGSDLPTVQGLTEGRAAENSGLEVGDTIVSINGEKIHVWRDITLISYLNDGEGLEVVYSRDGEEYTTVIVPTYSEEDNRYYIGIEGGTDYIEVKGLKLFKYSWYELVFNFRNTLKSLKQLVLGKLSKDDISGPVGIAQVVGESYDVAKDYGTSSVILTMMNIAMLLSVNLGVINLLPLPALDGGRLVFLFIEVVRGKPIPPEKEGVVHLIGIMLFFALTIFVLFNDISKFFR